MLMKFIKALLLSTTVLCMFGVLNYFAYLSSKNLEVYFNVAEFLINSLIAMSTLIVITAICAFASNKYITYKRKLGGY